MSYRKESGVTAWWVNKSVFVVIISALAMCVMTAVAAVMIESGIITETSEFECVAVILLISTFIGSCAIKSDDWLRTAILRAIGCMIFYCLLLCIAALFFSCGYESLGFNAVMVFLGYLCSFATGLFGKNKSKQRRYKYRTR